MTVIPKLPQDGIFRMSKQNMIKVHLFINGHSMKNRCNVEYDLLSHSGRASLETFYTALLIWIRALHRSSLLDNTGAHYPE